MYPDGWYKCTQVVLDEVIVIYIKDGAAEVGGSAWTVEKIIADGSRLERVMVLPFDLRNAIHRLASGIRYAFHRKAFNHLDRDDVVAAERVHYYLDLGENKP